MFKNNDSVFEQILDDEECVCGSFGEAAGEVGVPLVAEGDVDADVEAVFHETILEVAADSEEHLEFESIFRDVVFVDKFSKFFDDFVVLGSDGGIVSAFQQSLGLFDIFLIDF